MRTSRWIILGATLAAAVAGFVLLTACEKEPNTDISMGGYSSGSHSPGLNGPTLNVQPAAATISHIGEEILFTVQDGNPPFVWSRENTTGTITPQSDTRQAVYHATSLKPNTIYATENNGTGRSGMAKITAGQSTIVVTPNNVTISVTNAVGNVSIQFKVSGGTGPYTWDVSRPDLGEINPSGLYSGYPNKIGQNTVFATDTSDGTFGTATVNQQ